MSAKEINLTVLYGDDPAQVRLLQFQNGVDTYQVYIDKYYNGTVTKRDGRWIGLMNTKSELTTDDIMVIGEIIENS